MPREPEVVFPEQAEVGEAMAQHRNPLDPEAEREAGPHLRVVADVLKHDWVDHAPA